jgi:hypothetical protein
MTSTRPSAAAAAAAAAAAGAAAEPGVPEASFAANVMPTTGGLPKLLLATPAADARQGNGGQDQQWSACTFTVEQCQC